jgi:hypothetical protein
MKVLTMLRTIAATVAAVARGVVSLATGGKASAVTLQRGDIAPDFTLSGSDGRTYRLRDLLGHGQTIVLAWFPKAFTGG